MTIDSLRQHLAERPMTPYQLMVVAACVVINVLDGFDILSVAFAAPAISREWSLAPDRVGILLSAGLAGIGAGALIFSIIADAIGRRPVILAGLVLIAAGMIAASLSSSLTFLMLCRVVTGLGIGGMTSTAGTLAIEYSAARWRTLSVALVVIGYPLGATVGGFIAVWLLGAYGWRSIFLSGGLVTLLLIPLLWWRMPESIAFLAEKQPHGAIGRINRYAAHLGYPPIESLPARVARGAGGGYARLFRGHIGRSTALLCGAYAMFMFSFYFIINWSTSLVTRLGLPDSAGVTTTAIINLSGVVGGFLIGLLSARLPLTKIASAVLLVMGAAIAAFGYLPADMVMIGLGSVLLGFFMWSGSALLYSVIAMSYPVTIRATGIGLVITAGRVGSILGPYAGGVLLAAGMGAGQVTAVLALPTFLCALLILKARPTEA